MELRKAELARAMHLLDQMSARVQGGYSLQEIIGTSREVRPCLIYPLMMCEYGLEEPCTDCPHWKEIDGE